MNASMPDIRKLPAMADDIAPHHLDLLKAGRLGVLATQKRDGRPQLSTIVYAYDEAQELVRISITDSRAKTKNLRRDPRASLHVQTADGWTYAVFEGIAELSPVAETTDDATADELAGIYRAVQGEHPNWAEFRQAMVDDGRLVVRLHPTRSYGSPPR